MTEYVKYNENHYSINVPNFGEIGVINRVGGQFVVSIHNRDVEISGDGLVEILGKVRELNASLRDPSDQSRPPMESEIMDIDGKQILAVVHDGTIHIGPVTLIAPRDESEDLLTQASNEFQDAFM